jgi:3-oxoacyl-[acyl-carrier-protein] synthase III
VTSFGVSAIATFQPALSLSNDWFEGRLKRKFAKHTGIQSRSISFEDEVEMGLRAARALEQETGCDCRDCAAVVFVSPSLIPMSVAHRLIDAGQAKQEQPTRVAQRFADAFAPNPRRVLGINGFCSGYARGLALVIKRILPSLGLTENEYVLLVTSSRISRITDFSCEVSGALFGDFATVTLLADCQSQRYPVHFQVVDAQFRTTSVKRPLFDFSRRTDVLAPTSEGGRRIIPDGIVFSLDGMGIADAAPRAMTDAALRMVQSAGLQSSDIQCIVPHQAGTGIVRQTGWRLEDAGFPGRVVNGLTERTGNVSSCSVPLSLKRGWNDFSGYVLCPVAAVGAPGKREVSQGCVLLRSVTRR